MAWVSFIYLGLQVSFSVLVLHFLTMQVSYMRAHLVYLFGSQYDFTLSFPIYLFRNFPKQSALALV